MRTRPLLGTKLWFKPRGWGGWGWSPASWEGWVVAGLATVAILSLASAGPSAGALVVGGGSLATVALLTVVCTLKGTTPGGPAKQAEYHRLIQEDEAVRRQPNADGPSFTEALHQWEEHDDGPCERVGRSRGAEGGRPSRSRWAGD